ncbi:ABC transporter substrate-binding protein [Subtercola frigoramans]|uniref:ABC-type branched-subunit amino acid transport system substrate-binding protein n=1 Tax=Subtercola frigoramans TaxID=120298 RepID=A0ABS2L118_9MICO|nr:ABC transporter substrate-binding protein [Subtercola frigoramans]MBM7470767.1 ABC-type branched-subunit amino acid transport system substrate-binding protein [Subtercola frigoramans]
MKTRNNRKTIFTVAGVALLAVSLGGCSAASPSASPTGAAQTPLAGLTGEPITVMTIGNWTQPQLGTANPEFPAGAQAAAAALNARGGIGGRPIDVIVCSDELSTDTARQCALDAVQKGVVAVVGLQTTNEVTILPILEAAGIPAVGVYPFTDVALTSPVSFPDTSGFVGQTLGMGLQLASAGAKKVSTVVPGGLGGISTSVGDAVAAGSASGGATSGGLVQIPAKSADLSPTIATATEGGASVAGFASDEAAFITAMRTIAPDSNISTFPFNLSDSVISSAGSAAEGVMAVDGLVPPSADTAGTTQYKAELQAYDPSLATSTTGLHEWLAMWTFERVIAGLPSVDAASVTTAMNGVENLDMGGVIPTYTTKSTSTTYPRMFNPTIVYQKVADGHLVLQDSGADPFVSIQDLITTFAG